MSRSRRALSRKWSILEKRVEKAEAIADRRKEWATVWKQRAHLDYMRAFQWRQLATKRKELLRRWNIGRYQSGTACWFCGQIPEKIQGSEEWLWNYKDCHLDHCELAKELKDG